MRRPWVVGVEVPGEGIGEGRHGWAAKVVPLEWWGSPGRRHAVRTVIKAMMAQLRPPVLLVLHGSHGNTASRVPWPSVLWAATGWWLTWRERERERERCTHMYIIICYLASVSISIIKSLNT